MTSLRKQFTRILLGDVQPVDTRWLKMPRTKLARRTKQAPQLTERDLIHRESEIGAHIFGDIPKGHQREFFCLDADTWIWYEQWLDANNKSQSQTTRYEIKQNGILKVQAGPRYTYIDGAELDNFVQAVTTYYERVARDVYHAEPQPV